MTRQFLKRLAIRYPALARHSKPLLVPIINKLYPPGAIPVPVAEAPPSLLTFPPSESAIWLERLHAAACGEDGLEIGSRAVGSDILMLVMSDLRIDPRVEREARALAAGGYKVTVMCPSPFADEEAWPKIDWGKGVTIQFISISAWSSVSERPGFHAHLLFRKAFEFAQRKPLFAVHAHDLSTSYAGFALARAFGCHLIVDFHEWVSENVRYDAGRQDHCVYEPSWKYQLQNLEARVVHMSSIAITVCDSIADAIERELSPGRRPAVIRNIPALSAIPTKVYPPLKTQLGLPEDQFVLLYQGGTGPLRLLEPIIEALAFAPKCVLAIRGPALEHFSDAYRKIAQSGGFESRLILLPPVPSRDVVAAARGADAGIYSVLGICRNFIYALPNKVFEYTAARLPILTADYPEAGRFVESHGLGLTFKPDDPRSIAAAINRLIEDPDLARRCRENTQSTLASIDADGEWRKLVALYDALPHATNVEARA